MSMWEPFTERARRSVVLAQEEAHGMGCDFIGTEHLLLGILSEGEGIAAKACAAHGITLASARIVIRDLGTYTGTYSYSSEMAFTPRAKRVIEIAFDVARERSHNYIGTEHIFIAIFKEGEGIGAKALAELGLGDILASMSAGQLTA